MDFDLPEDLKLLQDTAREFAEADLVPHAADLDRKEEFPSRHWPKLSALGFLGMLIPERYGGAGLGQLAMTVALEEYRGFSMRGRSRRTGWPSSTLCRIAREVQALGCGLPGPVGVGL
jgi:alkylation response protein AidB-like acyl-CoA dehydrogenase